MMLSVEMNPAAKRRYFFVRFGQRGRPNVITSQTMRSLAMCFIIVVSVVDPNQKLGDKLRMKAQDPNLASKQVAQLLRDQFVDPVNKNMVRASLLLRLLWLCSRK